MMRYLTLATRPLHTVLVFALTLTMLLAAAPAAAAGKTGGANLSNSVSITIAGGDATAIASCLTDVKNKKGKTRNTCHNTAYAAGGSVILKNVDITVVQANDADGDVSNADNTVDLTIRGGDAVALADCVTDIKNKKGKTRNSCTNSAIAVGGDVILKNVSILVIQENT